MSHIQEQLISVSSNPLTSAHFVLAPLASITPPVFLGRPIQALHTWNLAVHLIIPGGSSQAMSDWMGSLYELPGLPADVISGLIRGFG